MSKIRDILDLYVTFFKIGSVTFGGGIAMLPILERELVDKRHWTDNNELLDYYAIAQTTPGIIAVNVSTFIGHKRAGIAGGIFATLGVASPSIVIISLIAKFISTIDEIDWVKKALAGINIAVAANLTYSTVKFAQRSVKNFFGAVMFLAAFVAIFFFNIKTVWVIFSAVFIGIVQAFFTGQLNRADYLQKKKGGK
ncbi:MAG: chromate transporter [Treponema sp.]|jgi:chromate transporter|nr:chromate transporter [Treponema sp.]